MKVHEFMLGPIENNCFLVEHATGQAVLIDAPMGIEELIDYVEKKNIALNGVMLTHSHFDHTGGLDALTAKWRLPIYIYESEFNYLTDMELSGSSFFGFPQNHTPATHGVRDGEIVTFGDLKVKVLHTPGHTVGGCSFLAGNAVFTGDALFQSSIGRTDLPESSLKALFDGIKEKLYVLPDETRVYPGHGAATTIGEEKRSNPFTKHLCKTQ